MWDGSEEGALLVLCTIRRISVKMASQGSVGKKGCGGRGPLSAGLKGGYRSVLFVREKLSANAVQNGGTTTDYRLHFECLNSFAFKYADVSYSCRQQERGTLLERTERVVQGAGQGPFFQFVKRGFTCCDL